MTTPGSLEQQQDRIKFFVETYRAASRHRTDYEQLSKMAWLGKLTDDRKVAVREALDRRRAEQTILDLEESWKAHLLSEVLGPAIGQDIDHDFPLSSHVRRLAEEGQWEYMETYLALHASEGAKKANKDWRRHAHGTHWWSYAWHGFIAIFEVGVAVRVFFSLQSGFPTVVVALLCMMYCVLSFQLSYVTRIGHGHLMMAVTNESQNKFAPGEEEERVGYGRSVSLMAGLQRIGIAKLSILEIMALVFLFHQGI